RSSDLDWKSHGGHSARHRSSPLTRFCDRSEGLAGNRIPSPAGRRDGPSALRFRRGPLASHRRHRRRVGRHGRRSASGRRRGRRAERRGHALARTGRPRRDRGLRDRLTARGRRPRSRGGVRRRHAFRAPAEPRSGVGALRLHSRARGHPAGRSRGSAGQRALRVARRHRVVDAPRNRPRLTMRVVTLAGGTGAAKLLRGLATCVTPRELTVIGNTGDDTEVWGLHISPDLDTVTYALAGLLDVERGWGLTAETFNCLAAMAAHGADTWFNLGDRDLATHLMRTRALAERHPLSTVTARLATDHGVASRILPMSDDPVRTMIRTPGGRLTFQEYFVREKALVDVLGVDYDGEPCAPWLRRLLIDSRDRACVGDLARVGVEAEVAEIVMTSRAHEATLARRVLDAALARRAT